MVAEKTGGGGGGGGAGGKRMSVVCPFERSNWLCELAQLRSVSDVIFPAVWLRRKWRKMEGEEKELKLSGVQCVI